MTGPTGSGKTTTLYSALNTINLPDKKIITIEDPIEYQMDGVNQISVNTQIGLSFGNGLRHIVRQDPDVIMVGEIRDLETAEIAIRAALTGHLVFSTLHTNDAPSADNPAHRHGSRRLPDRLLPARGAGAAPGPRDLPPLQGGGLSGAPRCSTKLASERGTAAAARIDSSKEGVVRSAATTGFVSRVGIYETYDHE